jgi:DNA-binding CsgD family transcriptional regulator
MATVERGLTRREIECLEWLGRGSDYAAIAKELGVTIPTVSLHVANARKCLGAATREQALVLALQRGLINP